MFYWFYHINFCLVVMNLIKKNQYCYNINEIVNFSIFYRFKILMNVLKKKKKILAI